MFGYTRDFDNAFDLLNQLRHRLDGVFDDFDGSSSLATGGYPHTNLYDTGSAFVLEADVPGLGENDFQLTLSQEVLTVTGKRKASTPEGYSVHRRERAGLEFSRSYGLPAKVDSEKTQASLKDGVLTITLEKAPEVKPRQIAVRVS
jgi:HSP20 family protein